MIHGVNVINWTRPRWEDADWDDIDEKLQRASSMGFGICRIWVHFNYANLERDGGDLRLASRFMDEVQARAPYWPGEILFDWSWGYYGDDLAQSWAEDLVDGRFDGLVADWGDLLDDLGDERFSLSVGNEMDGLLRKSDVSAEDLALALSRLERPFTCGWMNEHSFDGPLVDAARGRIMRYSHYEKNEGWAANIGPLEDSVPICSGSWGVAEFGLEPRNDIDDAIEELRVRLVRFAALGARDVLLWALGAGDRYRWQLENPDYVAAFIETCRSLGGSSDQL